MSPSDSLVITLNGLRKYFFLLPQFALIHVLYLVSFPCLAAHITAEVEIAGLHSGPAV